jgi:hypothetical protein
MAVIFPRVVIVLVLLPFDTLSALSLSKRLVIDLIPLYYEHEHEHEQEARKERTNQRRKGLMTYEISI